MHCPGKLYTVLIPMGKESKKSATCTCTADSLCCTPEINTVFIGL